MSDATLRELGKFIVIANGVSIGVAMYMGTPYHFAILGLLCGLYVMIRHWRAA